MANKIKIACKGSTTMPLSELKIIQGELKTLPAENKAKLRKRIEQKGFDAPLFVWDKNILDGTQRKIVLDEMVADGWELPLGKVPVCEIRANNLEEAKDRLLGYVSQYGKVTFDGLREYLDTMEMPDLETTDLPDFDWEEFESLMADTPTIVDGNLGHRSLTETFGAPPFSVLDARQGYWQERKRQWLALGIKSEIGRGGGQ